MTKRTEQSKKAPNDDNSDYDPLKWVALELDSEALELDE
jgi:hypothetical protein